MKSEQKNPLHPIDIDDYPKLFDYVLTAQGLVYFQTLKRKYIVYASFKLSLLIMLIFLLDPIFHSQVNICLQCQ